MLLPETKPLDFEAYLGWVYTSQLTPGDTEDGFDRGMMIVRLYFLGDFLDDTKFCNTVMDTFHFNDAWDPFYLMFESMNLAWEETTAGSPLRDFILELLVYNIATRPNTESYLKVMHQSDISREIVLDLLLHMESKHGLSKLIQTTATLRLPEMKVRCLFHRHDNENPKCSKSKLSD